MIPDLQDYGIIFLSIAIFGFIALDIYKTGQGLGIPFYFKSPLEKVFHYISIAVLLFSFSLVIMNMLLNAPNQENFFTNIVKSIFATFQRSHEFGIISDESYILILKVFAFSTFFAFNYIILYSILLALGIFSRYNSMLRTNVYLKERPLEPIRFVNLITETNDFFFFEKEERINLWEAIRREDIKRIETITGSTKFEIILTNLKNSIRNYFHNRNI